MGVYESFTYAMYRLLDLVCILNLIENLAGHSYFIIHSPTFLMVLCIDIITKSNELGAQTHVPIIPFITTLSHLRAQQLAHCCCNSRQTNTQKNTSSSYVACIAAQYSKKSKSSLLCTKQLHRGE